MLTLLALTAALALPKDLSAAVAAWDEAQLRGDARAIDRLLADEYLLVSGSGALETKPQFKAELTDPDYKLDPFTIEEPIARIWLNGAVLGGVVRERGLDHGKSFDARIRFADVWAHRSGRWQLIYTHVSRP